MGKIKFYPTRESPEHFLARLAKRNKIEQFSLPIYEQGTNPIDYGDINKLGLNIFGRSMEIAPNELSNGKVVLSDTDRNPNEVVGLSSRVLLNDGKIAHLKHLDFDSMSADAETNFQYLRNVLQYLNESGEEHFSFFTRGTTGLIASSGGGCHYHGLQVLSDSEWRNWIGKARAYAKENLQLHGLDLDWCNIQLKRGFSILRMTSSKTKEFAPEFIYEVRTNS